VRIIVPRVGLETALQAEGIVDLNNEMLDDIGMLIGGTEDQPLHHDMTRALTSFVSKTNFDPQAEAPVAGWEVGRLEYNAAMSSPHAPSSIILGMGDPQSILLGVQKDQIKRISSTQCTIIGGTGQVLDIVCEREHLVILQAEKGVMFTGDFPHAGVRNVPEHSPENELVELLNHKISAILQDVSLTKREHLSAIVDMLCNFPDLNKLCRLFCSTQQLDGKIKNQRNVVCFSECFANPPGASGGAVGEGMDESIPPAKA
jgi:hypothetical protein